jgi:ankyrin repeat protein
MQLIDHLVVRALDGDRAYVRAALETDPALVDERNMFGAGIAHAAVYGGHPELLAILASHGWAPDMATSAALGDAAAVRKSLTAQPGLAARFIGTSTALHAAAYWGQLTVVRLLLEAGADAVVSEPSRDDFLQITPPGAAVATTPGIRQPSDDEDVVLALVRLLLEHGAAVNARRKDGMTALHGAAWRGLATVAQELIDAGADMSATATSGQHAGQTAADAALSRGHLRLAALLDAPGLATTGLYG